ncbi:unnamed protein product, partial [Mycena citricolor]
YHLIVRNLLLPPLLRSCVEPKGLVLETNIRFLSPHMLHGPEEIRDILETCLTLVEMLDSERQPTGQNVSHMCLLSSK